MHIYNMHVHLYIRANISVRYVCKYVLNLKAIGRTSTTTIIIITATTLRLNAA